MGVELAALIVEPDLKRIDAIQSKDQIVDELIRLHPLGVGALFSFFAGPDAKNSTQMIADADQGGLGLPDRDYYLRTDPKSAKLRDQYVAHVQQMLELAGESTAQAAAHAQAVLRIETELAKGSLDRVARRDPNQTYHKMSVKDLQALAPSIDWPKYFAGLNTPPFTELNVSVPDFFKAVDAVLKNTSIADLKVYLRWHLIHSEAPLLAKPFLDANFHFFGQTLTGATELKPRWKRCVEATDDDLGFALGQKYVEQNFPPEAKTRVLSMVREIETMLGQDIQSLAWMTPATKQQALVKLQAVTNKIGYPDKWRDYSSVKIVRGEAVGNDERASEFEVHRVLNKIGTPVDPSEWNMTPPTVNAYYGCFVHARRIEVANFLFHWRTLGVVDRGFFQNAAQNGSIAISELIESTPPRLVGRNRILGHPSPASVLIEIEAGVGRHVHVGGNGAGGRLRQGADREEREDEKRAHNLSLSRAYYDKNNQTMIALRFQCQPGCTNCCEQQGFVYLTKDDLERIAEYVGMTAREFEKRFVYRTKRLLRLRVPRHQQCHFLRDGGCSIHAVKPVQCRLFPFWPELVDSKNEWKKTAAWCPGIGKGELVQIETARAVAGGMREAYPSMY